MISTQLFEGKQVQLRGYDLEEDPRIESAWSYDLTYTYLRSPDLMRPMTALEFKELAEADMRRMEERQLYLFAIQSRVDGRLLGVARVYRLSWNHGNAFLRVALGEKSMDSDEILCDCLSLMLNFCFYEMNLFRVTLETPEYQTSLVNCAKISGMSEEARQRKSVFMNGQIYDLLLLGIIRREWEEKMEHGLG